MSDLVEDVAPTTDVQEISLPEFSGPLDLLLHLIKRQELDITAISLADVTDQYLAYVETLKEQRVDELIEFIVIGARLVHIKSRALLPTPPVVLDDEEEEEDPAEALARQLRIYKQFKEVAGFLRKREELGHKTFVRINSPIKKRRKNNKELDLTGITVNSLLQAMEAALVRMEEMERSVEVVKPRELTVEKRLFQLRSRLRSQRQFRFLDLLGEQANRVEVAVSLLAVLELIKRREITVTQPEMFGQIEISARQGKEEALAEIESEFK